MGTGHQARGVRLLPQRGYYRAAGLHQLRHDAALALTVASVLKGATSEGKDASLVDDRFTPSGASEGGAPAAVAGACPIMVDGEARCFQRPGGYRDGLPTRGV